MRVYVNNPLYEEAPALILCLLYNCSCPRWDLAERCCGKLQWEEAEGIASSCVVCSHHFCWARAITPSWCQATPVDRSAYTNKRAAVLICRRRRGSRQVPLAHTQALSLALIRHVIRQAQKQHRVVPRAFSSAEVQNWARGHPIEFAPMGQLPQGPPNPYFEIPCRCQRRAS